MLFSMLHSPCATTSLTIWKETHSRKWTMIGALILLGFVFLVTFLVATTVQYFSLSLLAETFTNQETIARLDDYEYAGDVHHRQAEGKTG